MSCSNTQYIVPGLGPVSRKPRKLFGPVKPFLVHLYLKTEKCIRLKLGVSVKRTSELCNRKVRDLLWLYRPEKFSGLFTLRPKRITHAAEREQIHLPTVLLFSGSTHKLRRAMAAARVVGS